MHSSRAAQSAVVVHWLGGRAGIGCAPPVVGNDVVQVVPPWQSELVAQVEPCGAMPISAGSTARLLVGDSARSVTRDAQPLARSSAMMIDP